MPVTPRIPLGASLLARRWWLDVNTGTYSAPTWIAVGGVQDFKAPLDASVQSDDDYDSAGWKASTVSALGWKIDLKLARKETVASPLVCDPGAEVLRLSSEEMGGANRVDIRWYEVTAGGPKVESYRGYATVTWSEDGGGMDSLATVSVSLVGQGAREKPAHPATVSVVPALYSIAPAVGGTAGGSMHVIRGAGFMLAGVDDVKATSGVLFGVTNATSWVTRSDSEIVVVAPAKVAGPFVVYVENSVGKSVTATVTYTAS